MKKTCIALVFKKDRIKESIIKKIGDIQWGIGLYALEKIFKKECNAHGAGFGGEDISFTIFGKWVDFNWDEKRLEVLQLNSKSYEPEDIDPKIVAYLLRKISI